MDTTATPPGLRRISKRIVRYVRDNQPITFDQFLEMFGPKDYFELVEGSVAEKPMVQWDHEQLLWWLGRLIGDYAEQHQLGSIAGSRTPVQTGIHGGRLPDLIFIKRERMDIVQQKALYGPPDLVIEIRSPSNSEADIVALESEYRSIGVAEIGFIDQDRRSVRLVRKRGETYETTAYTQGVIPFESVEGLWIRIEWLFDDPRITVPEALSHIKQGIEKD